MFELFDIMWIDVDGKGMINIFVVDKFMVLFRFYVIFLLWFLFEFFEELFEVGDFDKLKFVFFFDEVYLLFEDVFKVLVDKVE